MFLGDESTEQHPRQQHQPHQQPSLLSVPHTPHFRSRIAAEDLGKVSLYNVNNAR